MILMLSLEKKLLEPYNRDRAHERMIEKGEKEKTIILVLSKHFHDYDLSPNVRIIGVGGGRIKRMWNAYRIGKDLLKKNDIRLITAQDPVITGLPAIFLKCKIEIQLHGDFFSVDENGFDYYRKESGLKNKIYYWIARWTITKADILRVVGLHIKESLIKLGINEDIIYIQPIKV